jgi:hypothetical protein
MLLHVTSRKTVISFCTEYLGWRQSVDGSDGSACVEKGPLGYNALWFGDSPTF